MSEFSEQCKYYLTESGSNVYQLSQTFGLDRTTLQRMTTGKRLPGIEFVLKFCKCVRLNALQKDELLELYQMDKLGKAVYSNRKCIYHILEFLESQVLPPSVKSTVFGTNAWVEIAGYLERCFQSQKNISIYSNLPPNCISFFDSLKSLRLKYGKALPVKHIFVMQSNPSATENANSNLELLYTILPMMLSSYDHYEFYYYYSKVSSTDWDLSLFPYYIIADETVILISSDLSDVLYLTAPQHVRSYMLQFEHALTLCEPLFTQTCNLFEATVEYSDSFCKTGMPHIALEPHPCLQALAYSEELIDELNLTQLPGGQLIVDFFLFLRNLFLNENMPLLNFFTLEGLDYFVEKGRLCGHYEAFGLSFTPAQRVRMLQHLLSGTPNTYRPFMLKEGFPCGKNIHLELYDALTIRILYLEPGGRFYSLLLSENSIGYAVQDFMESLPDSDLVYTTEELHDLLNERIRRLEQML